MASLPGPSLNSLDHRGPSGPGGLVRLSLGAPLVATGAGRRVDGRRDPGAGRLPGGPGGTRQSVAGNGLVSVDPAVVRPGGVRRRPAAARGDSGLSGIGRRCGLDPVGRAHPDRLHLAGGAGDLWASAGDCLWLAGMADGRPGTRGCLASCRPPGRYARGGAVGADLGTLPLLHPRRWITLQRACLLLPFTLLPGPCLIAGLRRDDPADPYRVRGLRRVGGAGVGVCRGTA